MSARALVIQVKDLPAGGIDLEGDVTFAELELESDDRFDLANSVLHYRLHAAMVQQELYLTGSISTDVRCICDLCAEWAPLHLSDDEVFHSFETENFEPVDMTEDIREDVVLMFPSGFHCKEDCKGLCPRCGQNLNEGTCDCCGKPAWEDEDSPWSALSKLDKESFLAKPKK